jgi:hypothetical protein
MRKASTAPLKAYQVSIYGEACGVWVGRTRSQAQARCVYNMLEHGYRIGKLFAGLRSRRVHGLPAERAIERFEDAGKYWRHTRAFARMQAEASAVNTLWPIGTAVQVVNCCESSMWEEGVTFTRTPAWAASENYAFVSVEGLSGGLDLSKVVFLNEPR